jgi:hypothetical protein
MWTTSEEQTIRFLRGEENPFDAFVVPDQPAYAFPDCHAPEVHAAECDRICRAIDKYRAADYAARRQLHDTRVLIVRGVRGSGKTHLLHVLSHRETATPEIWVCPRYYDPAFPYTEYLLTEVVRTLLASEDAEAPARLLWCGRQLGRRWLREAVAALGPHEWREWTRGTRCGRVGGRWCRGGRWSVRQSLLERLWDDADPTPLAQLCGEHGWSAAAAHALAIRQIERSETGTGFAVRLRREVLLAFGELAFREDPDRLAALLEQDFALPEATLPPARAEVVTALLQTLAEVLAAVHVPIVLAFDNMERLLAPRGPVDLPTAQSFFNGLAHVIDQTRGLLLVLFVEHGLWNQFGPAINTFAEHRLRQGVRVRDYGCVWDLELKPPTPEQIEQVVARRMTPLLARAANGQTLPACFPFAAEEVRAIATAGVDVLRTALLRLRDRYDELVLPTEQPAPRPPREEPPAADAISTAAPDDGRRRDWEQAVAAGRRVLQGSRRTALAPELHAGLGRWLELCIGQEVSAWRLTAATSAVTYGDRPTFGLVTVGTWQAADGQTCRVALGPILGEGRAMPKDLETKLALFHQRPPLAEQLVVLWPVPEDASGTPPLPPATRQVWEQGSAGRAVTLCPLRLTDFAWLLGLPEWLATHATAASPDAVRSFVLERTGYLLQDFAPRGP